MFSISRPDALWLILLIVPGVLYSYYRFKHLVHVMYGFFPKAENKHADAYLRLRRAIVLRSIFLACSWVCFILALSGISFGTKNVPVQKSGNAVCMVFDISYSMNARDEKGGVSRLEAVKSYAHSLLDQMEGDSVSVVLAKGDGIIAVPLTEDYSYVDGILESLSPKLMSSSGSSIGKGIEAAISAFPHNSGQSFNIWVFTDGDETDSEMAEAFSEAVKFGIPVTVVGFGSEKGAQVQAGDGVTSVHTSLKAQKIRLLAEEANSRSEIPQYGKTGRREFISFIPADSKGSAFSLINSLAGKNSRNSASDFEYEVQRIPRYGGFLIMGIIFFILSIIADEFNLSNLSFKGNGSAAMMVFVVILPFMLGGCSENMNGASKVLSGTWDWHQKEYQPATAEFYQAVLDCQAEKNDYVLPYALYGLASTYLMEEEYDAAIDRIRQLPGDSSPQILSAAYYDLGIIANRLGNFEEARENFKQAVLYDSTNLNAKINLELTDRQAVSVKAQSAEKQMTSVQITKENSALEQAVFNLIREEEQQKWKNLQSGKKDESVTDY